MKASGRVRSSSAAPADSPGRTPDQDSQLRLTWMDCLQYPLQCSRGLAEARPERWTSQDW